MSLSFLPPLFRTGHFLRTAIAVNRCVKISSVAEMTSFDQGTRNDKMQLKLSENCVERLKKIASGDAFLRVMVEGGGCSGFQYIFDLDTVIKEDDHSFERDGVRVIVDEISLQFLSGSTIDYKEELIRSAFRVVNNPKADLGCSCGASFSVKTAKSDENRSKL